MVLVGVASMLLLVSACTNQDNEATALLQDPTFGLSHLNDEFHTVKGTLAGLSEAGSTADRMVSMVTVRSVPDPFAGHEDDQLAVLIPPDNSGRVLTGTLSYTATKPVQAVVLFPYSPPGPSSAPHGELDTVDVEGQLYSFTIIESGKFATMPFSGAGLALHTLGGPPFEASASIRAIVEDQTATE